MTDINDLWRRFSDRIEVRIDTGCFEWCGTRYHGYGYLWAGELKRNLRAHRVFFEAERGAIPDGLTLDHLCRNRSCVNPWHLEPVPNKVNILRGQSHPARNARKAVCLRGHPLSGKNLYLRPDGYRACRECHLIRQRASPSPS